MADTTETAAPVPKQTWSEFMGMWGKRLTDAFAALFPTLPAWGRKAQIAAAITFALALSALGAWHYGWFNNATAEKPSVVAERVPAPATATDVQELNASMKSLNDSLSKLLPALALELPALTKRVTALEKAAETKPKKR